MRSIVRLSGLLLLSLLTGCFGGYPGSSSTSPVWDGATDNSSRDKKVFRVEGFARSGSSFGAKYRRCLVTAAHVIEDQASDLDLVAGVDATQSPQKTQEIVDAAARPNYSVSWTDLAVLWAANFQGTNRIVDADYEPFDLGQASGLGLGNKQLTDDDPVSYTSTTSTGAPVVVLLFGYGHNATTSGTDTGAGIRRWGGMDANYYFQGSLQTTVAARTGSFVAAEPNPTDGGCNGDSGGPMVKNGGQGPVYGVTSASYGATCAATTETHFTTFDTGSVNNEKSNWTWLNETIERVCKKEVRTDADEGGGKVMGSISPGQSWVDPNWDVMNVYRWVNNQFNCRYNGSSSEQDCTEEIHEGQTVTLEAIPDQDYAFDEWVTPMGWPHCPCEGSSDPECVMEYDDVGSYYTDASYDMSVCRAIFEYTGGSSGG